MVYAVIDTNVLVSALLSVHQDSATVILRDKISDGSIRPLYNDEIFNEYRDVLSRPKFKFPSHLIAALLELIQEKGQLLRRTPTKELFVDTKDIVFYEVALSKEDSFLVTGNKKHFPNTPIVVTPTEMLEILKTKS